MMKLRRVWKKQMVSHMKSADLFKDAFILRHREGVYH